mmetsp:Transcript_7585/g.8714  ORF Transcript_7585/g.8714 Transcript_7585/m.8714 type:complete len:258 (+) Transcript_7585:138-911(+)
MFQLLIALSLVALAAANCEVAVTTFENDFDCKTCVPSPFTPSETGIIPECGNSASTACSSNCQLLIDTVVNVCDGFDFSSSAITDENVNEVLWGIDHVQVGECNYPFSFNDCDVAVLELFETATVFPAASACGPIAGDNDCDSSCTSAIDSVFSACKNSDWMVVFDGGNSFRGEQKPWNASDAGFTENYWDRYSTKCQDYINELIASDGPDDVEDDGANVGAIVGGVVGAVAVVGAAGALLMKHRAAKTAADVATKV